MRARHLVLATLLLLAALVLYRATGRARPDGDVQGRVLEAVRGPGSTPPLAGISARARVDVAPLRPRAIGADTSSHDYHRYMNRCMACHEPPDPAAYTIGEWPGVIDRMHGNMRAAGTLGLSEADRAAVLRFLARHAKGARL